MAGRFRHLHVGLGVILGFVGIKMMLANVYHLPTWASLLVIAVVLTITVVLSLRADKRERGMGPDYLAPDPAHPHPSAEPDVSDPDTAPPEDRRSYLDR